MKMDKDIIDAVFGSESTSKAREKEKLKNDSDHESKLNQRNTIRQNQTWLFTIITKCFGTIVVFVSIFFIFDLAFYLFGTVYGKPMGPNAEKILHQIEHEFKFLLTHYKTFFVVIASVFLGFNLDNMRDFMQNKLSNG